MDMQAAVLATVSAAATWVAASYYFSDQAVSDLEKKSKSSSDRQQDQVRADYAATITRKDEIGCCDTSVVCFTCFSFEMMSHSL